MKRFSTLHSRILLLLLAIVLPVLFILTYSAYEQKRAAVKALKQDVSTDARILADLMEQKVGGVRQLLMALSHGQAILQRDAAACNKSLTELKKHFPEYVNFGVADPKGNIFCSVFPITKPVNSRDLAWFKNAIVSQDIGIGNYQIGRITGKQILNIGYAARDESGRIQAVLYAPFHLESLNELFGKIKLGPETVFTMLDRNGTILVRRPDHEKWVGKTIKESDVIKTILTQHEGLIEAYGVDGIMRIYSFIPVAGTDNSIFISIGIPKDVALTDINRHFARNLLLFGLLAALSFAAALMISRLARQSEKKLVESRERFRAIASNTPDHILMQDGELRYTFVVNPQLGLTEQDMLGKTDYDFLPKEEADNLTKIKRRILETGEPLHFVTSLISKEGKPEYFDGTYVPKVNAHGMIDGLIGYFRNVAERVKAEAEIKKTGERLRNIIDGLGQEMFVGLLTPDGRVLEANQPALYVAGLKLEDVINKPVEEAYWFSYSESVKNQLRNAVELAAGGKPSRFDVEIRVGENQFITLDFSMQPLRNETGRVVFLIPSALVVTARRKAEAELRITNEELQAINRIITTTTTTTTTGVKEILEKVLDEVLQITGLEGGTICIVTPDDTLHLAAHRATSEATIQDLTTNIVRIGECLCGECARDHKPLILRDREAVLKFATREATRGEDIRFHAAYPLIIGEKCLGVLCIFTRTDKKPSERSLKLIETVSSQIAIAVQNAQLYEEIKRHSDILENQVNERTLALQDGQKALTNMVEDLNQKSTELRAANERLKEIDRLKSMFIASMSHELRTPLNSVIGFSSILLNEWAGPLNDEQKENLATVLRSGKHLLSLINDVIDVSKIEAGTIDVHAEDFDLHDVIAEVASHFTKDAGNKGLEFIVENLHQPMHTDRRRLLQSVINLVSNGVKFTERGSVRVSVRRVRSSPD